MRKTKFALMQSVIALLLCFSMLIGTTFAWFTDEVISGSNIIQAGNLDAEMYWTDDLSTGTWYNAEKAGENTPFDYDLWEPGYTEVRYVKIVNAGKLALKYNLTLAPAGEVGKLAEVIDVYYAENVTANIADRTLSGMTKLGALLKAMNGAETAKGELLPGGETIVAVALHMDELAGNEYQGKSIGDGFVFKLLATQLAKEPDSFGPDYDENATFPVLKPGSITADISSKVQGSVLTEAVTMVSEDGAIAATVPAGTKVSGNSLILSVSELSATGSNITLQENEILRPMDVHIEGVAAENTAPILVTVKEAMMKGLNIGNYQLYHVEQSGVNTMTAGALDQHNGFTYDPATGDVTVALATFSEVTMVAEPAKWEGNFDYSWYTNAVAPVDGESVTEYTIANADQLAAFGAIVGGMKKVTERVDNKYTYSDEIIQDSFKDKTVKLIADINLGDDEVSNPSIIFYPIGYYNSEGTYERTNTAITSGLRIFEGTFDGNGHTVSNFYHNTWEMKGDHNWYSPEEQYYRDGMGLFGRVYKGTVKNLTVKNFSSDGEIATTGVIAAYADGATFENIAIFNCNPRVYNIGNGGIVGCVGWYAKEENLKTTFKNITVDNSNKISALWGSYDVACGGIVGQYYPTSGQTSAGTPKNGGVHFENCHISAQMDVYNDVCANYQYYAYRYTGMLIGSVRENVTIDGKSYPKMDGITASGCTVHFGDWNDYYYCEIIDNTTASYTHDYQMSRLVQIDEKPNMTKMTVMINGKEVEIPKTGRANYVVVNGEHATENATCYHFKDGEIWNHADAGYHDGKNGEKFIDENGDGEADLKEDKQHIYLEFNNLVTGYGWGVTSKGLTDFKGVTNMDITQGDYEKSVEKFEGKVETLTTDRIYDVGEIFSYLENCGVKVIDGAVNVTITNLDENGNVIATFDRGEKWNEGTISFENTGNIAITIQDYYFCEATTITVDVVGREPEVKFETKFTGDFLYRVGNQNAVKLDSLFKAVADITGNVTASIETVTGASGTYTSNATWTNGTIQFSGTGVVKVTITDNDYCTPTVLYLEVVDAKNVTSAESATANNVVLLNDCGLSSLTVSGRYAFYGNGFTATYTGNGQYLNNGLRQGVVTVSENGTLDNLRIEASIYPSAYLYYGQTSLGEYVQGGPSSVEGDKTRYHYQLSAVAASGNATIQNCYIYGGRNNIFVNTGDVTIKDTVLECAPVANVQIQSNASHTITLENVTTIQYQVNPTIGDASKVMLGAGIIVGPDTTENPENPEIVLNGDFKQYNWVTSNDANAVSSETTKMIINGALNATEYNHTINGKNASNLGIVYMNKVEAKVENNTKLPYKLDNVDMTVSGVTVYGKVYSLQNATADQIYSDHENADKSTVNGLYQPQFKYSTDLSTTKPEVEGDEHCYREGDTIYVMFPSGDTKELNLTALVNIVKYSGQNLNLVVTCKDENGNEVTVTNGKVKLSEAGKYTVTYTVTDNLFYDKGARTETEGIKYSWNVTVVVSLKDTAIPDARFEFDATKQKMGYYKPSWGDVKQYLPFLAGLKIYDYNGKTEYLRFDGSNDFNKVASITITGYASNKASVEIKLTDGGVINTQFLARANSGGGSTYTGKIKTSNNTIYFVTDSGTSNKDTTTTAAYWYVDYYKFTGNNGVGIQSGQQTFNSTGSSASTPSGSFSATIKYTVTYDANGGNCGQTTGYATSVSAAVTLPTPARSGYIFAGWYTAVSGGDRVGGAGESYTPSANTTLYAQWGKPCTVTYNANCGSCDTASEKYTGTALTLPTPIRDGYWFVGWYDAAEGGNKIGDAGATYNPSSEITLYAHWQEKVEYTVTYNANGGTCGTTSATYQGAALTLPTPTRTGYKFLGWYDAASGGTKIGDAGASYTPSSNITLYAQWEKIAYTITVTTSNATVSGVTDGQTAYYGDTISVTVNFSKNNSKTLTVKDASGNTVLSKSADGTYTFTMPASNVTIEARSSGSCVTADTLVTLADGTQKRIDQVTFADQLLVWDFDKGEYTAIGSSIIENHGYDNNTIIKLTFEDGTAIRVVNVHGFFDADLNKWVDINAENAQSFVGHSFTQVDGDSYKTVKLVSAEVTTEYVEAWSILSANHYNCILEGLFSVTPPATLQLAFYEIGEGMKYDAEAKQADIEKYGLYTYEEFAHLLTYEQFDALNVPEIKVAVGKGLITYGEILWLIETYIHN